MSKIKRVLKILWQRLYYILGLIIGIIGFIGLFNGDNDAVFLFIISMICFHQDDDILLNKKYNDLYDKVLEHQKFNLETFDKIIKRLK